MPALPAPVKRARKAVMLTLVLVAVIGLMVWVAWRDGVIPAPVLSEVTATGMRWDVADNSWSDLGDGRRGLDLALAYQGGAGFGAVDGALARAVCWQVLAKLDLLEGAARADLAWVALHFRLDPAAEPDVFTVPVVKGQCQRARPGGPGGRLGRN